MSEALRGVPFGQGPGHPAAPLSRGRPCRPAVLAALLALAGCTGSGTGGLSSAIPFAQSTPLASQPALEDKQEDFGCPAVDVLEGTAGYRVGAPTGGARGVQYQASIADLSRECAFAGNTVTIRVGIAGRVLIGEAGKPGTYSVPVRVAVKRGDKAVYSNLRRVSVTVPNGESQADFAHIEEGISLPISSKDPSDEYEILVGFDPTGTAALKRERKRR